LLADTRSVPLEAPMSAVILSEIDDGFEFATTNATCTPGSLVMAVLALWITEPTEEVLAYDAEAATPVTAPARPITAKEIPRRRPRRGGRGIRTT
jgi:hypothetical protein